MLSSRPPSQSLLSLVSASFPYVQRNIISQRPATSYRLPSTPRSKQVVNLAKNHSFSQSHGLLKDPVSSPTVSKSALPTRARTPSVNETSAPGINLFSLIREAKRPVRYTIYGALGIQAIVECTFWTKVIKHKFFANSEEEKEGSDEFFRDIGRRVGRYRVIWLGAYKGYYGETVWGL
jgi:hypothetical protein